MALGVTLDILQSIKRGSSYFLQGGRSFLESVRLQKLVEYLDGGQIPIPTVKGDRGRYLFCAFS